MRKPRDDRPATWRDIARLLERLERDAHTLEVAARTLFVRIEPRADLEFRFCRFGHVERSTPTNPSELRDRLVETARRFDFAMADVRAATLRLAEISGDLQSREEFRQWMPDKDQPS